MSRVRPTATVLLTLAVAVGGLWWLRAERSGGPQDGLRAPPGSFIPPAPDDIETVGPLVAERIRAALAEARGADDADDAGALGRLAMVYHAHEMNALAAAIYQELSRREPGNARWPYLHALVQVELGRPATALDLLDAAIALAPGDATAHWRRGFLLLDEGRPRDAERSFQRSLELNPSAAATVGMARVHLARGAPAEAIPRLERLVRSRSHPYYHHLLGTACQRVGREEEARSHRSRATGEVPDWRDDRLAAVMQLRTGYRSIIDTSKELIAAGRAPDALRRLRELEKTHPDDVTVLNLVAAACFRSGRHAEAMEALARALELDPNSFATHGNLAYGYEQATPPDLGRSMEHARRAVEINPTYGHGHLQIGRLHIRAGAYDRAADALSRALESGVDDARTRVMYGQVLNAIRQWERSGAVFERIIAGHPDLAPAHIGLARARMEAGRMDEARAALERARRLDPNDSMLPGAAQRLQQIERGGP